MAKGKSKAKFPEQYQQKDEDAKAARAARANAPQAKPHKRGGVHRVIDEHKTDTKWDTMTRNEMVVAALHDPVYQPFFTKFKDTKQKVKDLKKQFLLQTLGDAEKDLERRAKEKKKNQVKLRKEAEVRKVEEEEKKKAEQQRKQEERLRREEEGQILSDEEVWAQVHPHVYLQQEDSEISDTTTTQASISPTYPSRTLRIFEWSFADPPSSEYWRTPRIWPQNQELQPRPLPYSPMNVMTMHQHEMLHTPGIDYKDHGTEPDHVPVLSQQGKSPEYIVGFAANQMNNLLLVTFDIIKVAPLAWLRHQRKYLSLHSFETYTDFMLSVQDCARNGVLIGPLEGAVVESGSDWSKRTIVQGWNGRMYFSLPRPDEDDLAEVYRQWKSHEAKRKRRADRKPLHEAGVHKADPRLKAIRKKEQRRITKNVYKASQWRPTLVYLPVYLSSHFEAQNDGSEDRVALTQDVEDLYYIRLRGESIPSFFFWVDEDEWEDPTKVNPQYENYDDQHTLYNVQIPGTRQRRFSRLIRVKKTPSPRRFSPTTKIPRTSRYETVLWAIERDIYNHSFESTLQLYHNKWMNEGKKETWKILTNILRHQLPPSGRLPTHPPVRPDHDPSMISIAEKMARVESFSDQRPVLPIYINDDWTRNDDAYWTTEELPEIPAHGAMEMDMQYATPVSRSGRPICGPGTPGTPQSLHRRISDVFAWVSTVSTPGSQFYNPPSPAAPQQIQQGTDLALNILVDRAPNEAFRHDMWKMMQERYLFQGQAPWLCAICLENLGDVSLVDYEQHLINHMVHIAIRCPFCNMKWETMTGENKARHVRHHREDQDWGKTSLVDSREHVQTGRGRATQTPPELQGRAAVPRFSDNPGPRRPSVRFSRTTVEKRTAYNDFDDSDAAENYAPGLADYTAGPKTTGSEAEISTWKSSSRPSSRDSQRSDKSTAKEPHKSSIKKRKKSTLTIHTDDNGRGRLEYDLTSHDYLFRQAHDPRRRSSSRSSSGQPRNLRLYTYVDNGDGWDRSESDSDSDGDSDDEWPTQWRKSATGGKIRQGTAPPGQVVEIGSGDEEGEYDDDEWYNEQPSNHDDVSEEHDESGDGDGGGNEEESDDYSSGNSEEGGSASHLSSSRRTSSSRDESRAEEEEDDEEEREGVEDEEQRLLSHSSNRPDSHIAQTSHFSSSDGRTSSVIVGSSGLTEVENRRVNNGEVQRANKRLSVSSLTPESSKQSPQSEARAENGGGGGGGGDDSDESDDFSDDEDGDSGGGRGSDAPSRRRSSSRKSNSSSRKSTSSRGSATGPAPPPSTFTASGWAEWPAPVHLWYNLTTNLNAMQQEIGEEGELIAQDEEDFAEEPSEVLEQLPIEDAYTLMSVKKRKRPHVPSKYASNEQRQEHVGPGSSRSSAPSPTSSLARAERSRHNSVVPPNTPAIGIGELPARLEGSQSQPPRSGQISDKIGSVGTTHTGESRVGASTSASASASRANTSSSTGSHLSSRVPSKKTSSSSGSDIPLAQRVKARAEAKRTREEAERARSKIVNEGKKKAKEPPKKRLRRTNKLLSEDEEEEQEEEPPAPKPKAKPPRANTAKKIARPSKTATETAQNNAPKSDEESDLYEDSQGESSHSIQSDEEGVSEYQPPRSTRAKAAKKGARRAPKKPAAKQGKQPSKSAVKKARQPRKRLTEAERLQMEADAWKKW